MTDALLLLSQAIQLPRHPEDASPVGRLHQALQLVCVLLQLCRGVEQVDVSGEHHLGQVRAPENQV